MQSYVRKGWFALSSTGMIFDAYYIQIGKVHICRCAGIYKFSPQLKKGPLGLTFQRDIIPSIKSLFGANLIRVFSIYICHCNWVENTYPYIKIELRCRLDRPGTVYQLIPSLFSQRFAHNTRLTHRCQS